MTKVKRIKLVLITILTLIVIAGIIIFALYEAKKQYSLYFMSGRGKVDSQNGTIVWEVKGDSFNTKYYEYTNPMYLRYAYFLAFSVKGKRTTDDITDAQLISLRFSVDETLKEVTFAYDFYTKKVYVIKETNIFSIKENQMLHSFLVSLLDNVADMHGYRWYLQSTAHQYGWEPLKDTPTFRCNLHWKPTETPEINLFEYRNSGFKNRSVTPVACADEAIALATNEMAFQNPIGFALYDETCGYWMVELLEDIGYTGTKIYEITDQIRDSIYTVVIDNHGRTVETYRGCTTYAPFVNALLNETE